MGVVVYRFGGGSSIQVGGISIQVGGSSIQVGGIIIPSHGPAYTFSIARPAGIAVAKLMPFAPLFFGVENV